MHRRSQRGKQTFKEKSPEMDLAAPIASRLSLLQCVGAGGHQLLRLPPWGCAMAVTLEGHTWGQPRCSAFPSSHSSTLLALFAPHRDAGADTGRCKPSPKRLPGACRCLNTPHNPSCPRDAWGHQGWGHTAWC